MFKPHRTFTYNDAWFIRSNKRKLIPPHQLLVDFVDNDNTALYDNEYAIKLSKSITNFGLPTMANLIVPEVRHPYIFNHLDYITTSSTVTMLYEEMQVEYDDFIKWLDVVVCYFLSTWLTKNDCLQLLLYSPVYFNPDTLMFIDHPRQRFDDNSRKSIVAEYLKLKNIDLSLGERLANGIAFYGLSRYIRELEVHPFLEFTSVVRVVNSYILKGDRKSIKQAAILICLYFQFDTILKALTC